MATKLDWVDESTEYLTALEELTERVMKYGYDRKLSPELLSSLVLTMATQAVAVNLDWEVAMECLSCKNIGIILPQGKTVREAVAYAGIQTERYKWMLEHQLAVSFNINENEMRGQRYQL